MPPAVAAAGIAGAATIGSAAIGAHQAGKARKSAESELERVRSTFMNIDIPAVSEQTLRLKELAKVRPLTAEEEQTLQQGETLLAKIATDPAYKEAQMKALRSFEEVAEGGGLTAEDKFRLAQTQKEVGRKARGAREAVMQKAAARGTATGGAAITQQLMAEQEAADTAAMEGLGVNAMAQQRALEAIGQAGELGTKLRSQEYGEQAQAAQAQDVINRFNVAQAQDVMQRNIGRKMTADQFNIEKEMQRDIANVGIKNYEQQYNKGLKQKEFENKMLRAQGATKQAGPLAESKVAGGQEQAGMWGGIAQAVGGVGSSVAKNFLSETKPKTDWEYQGTETFNEKTGKWERA